MACSSHAGKEFRAVHRSRRFTTVFKTVRRPSLSGSTAIQSSSPSYFLKVHFNIIFSCRPMFPKYSLYSRFPKNSIVCFYFSFFVDEISVPWNVCYVVRWDYNMCWINVRIACVFISNFYLEKGDNKFIRGIFKFLPGSTKILSKYISPTDGQLESLKHNFKFAL
jgi:hypothetical protein